MPTVNDRLSVFEHWRKNIRPEAAGKYLSIPHLDENRKMHRIHTNSASIFSCWNQGIFMIFFTLKVQSNIVQFQNSTIYFVNESTLSRCADEFSRTWFPISNVTDSRVWEWWITSRNWEVSGKFWASVTGKRVSQLIGEYVGQARFWRWGFMEDQKIVCSPPKKNPPCLLHRKKLPPARAKRPARQGSGT